MEKISLFSTKHASKKYSLKNNLNTLMNMFSYYDLFADIYYMLSSPTNFIHLISQAL